MKSTSGTPVTRTTYGDHGFSRETVRYVLVYALVWDIGPFIGDLTDWGALMLRVNESDYERITLSGGMWALCDTEAMVLLNLKYRDNIIIHFGQNQMELIMEQARRRVSHMPKVRRIDGVDYMFVLSRMHMIKRALRLYLGNFAGVP